MDLDNFLYEMVTVNEMGFCFMFWKGTVDVVYHEKIKGVSC